MKWLDKRRERHRQQKDKELNHIDKWNNEWQFKSYKVYKRGKSKTIVIIIVALGAVIFQYWDIIDAILKGW